MVGRSTARKGKDGKFFGDYENLERQLVSVDIILYKEGDH
jgi:hypothetical protein